MNNQKAHKYPTRRWMLLFSAVFAVTVSPIGSWLLYSVHIIENNHLIMAMFVWATGAVAVWSNFRAFSGKYALSTKPHGKPLVLKFVLILTFFLSIIWSFILIKKAINTAETYLTIANAVLFIFTVIGFFYFIHISASLLFQFRIADYTHRRAHIQDYIAVLVLPLVVGGLTARATYYHEAVTVSSGPADFSVSASKLIAEFEKSDSLASGKYVGKVIRFGGIVNEVLIDTNVLLKLNARKDEFVVNCNFDKIVKDKVSGILVGDSVELQCSCSGVNKPDEEMSMLSESSLLMTRCSLLHWQKSKAEIGTDVEYPDTTNK
jgi:hypothetical protein